jgi:hypothetical protein
MAALISLRFIRSSGSEFFAQDDAAFADGTHDHFAQGHGFEVAAPADAGVMSFA